MIDIGKIINKVLTDNGIASYPVIAPEGASFPLVIYERSFIAENTKDNRSIDNNTIDIYVLAAEYKEAVTLALQIEDIITSIKGDVLGSRIFDSRLIAGNEMYYSGAYVQKLSFLIKSAVN